MISTIRKGLVVLFIFLMHIAYAQEDITGQVVESGTGETLPFATVIIKGTATGTTTNLDGYFSLLDIEANQTILEISYVGFQSKLVRLDSLDHSKFLKIYLEPISSELDEVIITANSYKVLDASSGISSTTISTKQLALLPNVGETDIFRSLQLLPGVSGTNESSSGLFVRGGTPDQNLVLLDGMTVYKVDHFFGFFSAFNANAVKDVQLFKGAFPSKYGGRTSSVVDMIGKIGSFEKVQGGASVNLLSVNGYLEIPLAKDVSFLIAGRRSYTDVIQSGLFEDISDNVIGDSGFDNPNLSQENLSIVEPSFYFYDWNSKLSYRPSDKDLITLSLYNGQDFLDESRGLSRALQTNQLPNGELAFNLDETTDWGNKGISGKWSRQWNPKLYSNFLIAGTEYFSRYDRDAQLDLINNDTLVFSGSQQSFEDNSVIDFSIRADFEWQRSAKVKTSFGVSFTQTEVDYSNIRNDTFVILERQQEAQYSSFYLSNERKIGEKLLITTGFRLSNYEFEDKPLFESRFNFSYQFTPEWKLKGAFGKHYQFVNRIINENITEGSREFWLLADGDLVNISSASHFVLGASYEIGNWLFDVEGYHKNLSGLSEFSLRFRRGPEIEADELFFTGDGVAKGVEFLVQKKQGKYTGWASYTLGSIRNTFEAFNEGQEFPALHDQLHEFKMVHSYEIGDWNFSSTFVYGSGKPFSEPEGQYSIELLDGRTFNYIGIGAKNGSRLPAYHRLDLSANRKFKIGKLDANMGVSLFNLYGRQNVWFIEYDFTQEPVLVSEVTYLGFTPNFSFSINF